MHNYIAVAQSATSEKGTFLKRRGQHVVSVLEDTPAVRGHVATLPRCHVATSCVLFGSCYFDVLVSVKWTLFSRAYFSI